MKSTLTALLAICLCLPLMGDDAAKKKFKDTKAKAEKGVAFAQSLLGAMYDNADGNNGQITAHLRPSRL